MTFNEVVTGRRFQKIRFDVDLHREISEDDSEEEREKFSALGESIKDRLITSIITLLEQDGISVNIEEEVLIFTSHGIENGEQKCSYHILLDGHVHTCVEEAKAFYNAVLNLDNINKDFNYSVIDDIYQSNKSLRMLWCHKENSSRTKIFNETFTYLGTSYTHKFSAKAYNSTHRDMQILALSLITFSDGCKILPKYTEDIEHFAVVNYTKEQVLEAVKLCRDYFGDRDFVYSHVTDKGLISLKRLRPSVCSICTKIRGSTQLGTHHSYPPYLSIINYSVYWYCGRAGKARIHLGNVTQSVSIPDGVVLETLQGKLEEFDKLYSNLEAPTPKTYPSLAATSLPVAPTVKETSHLVVNKVSAQKDYRSSTESSHNVSRTKPKLVSQVVTLPKGIEYQNKSKKMQKKQRKHNPNFERIPNKVNFR